VRGGTLVLLGAILLPIAAAAQSEGGVVTGWVADSAGVMLAGVEVRSLTGVSAARTGAQGQYRFVSVPIGEMLLEARRVGFRPETLHVAVSAEQPALVVFRLRAAANTLESVVVRAERQRHTGRLAGYFERLESNTGGYFITRDIIDEGDPRQLSDVLRKAPGVDIVRGRIRLRGRSCAPLVWLDGMPMPAGEVDINTFPPRTIEGIELYASASGAPFRYQGMRDDAKCGTVLLWSRGPDTEERRSPRFASVDMVERLRAAQSVLTSADVDIAAHPDSASPLKVGYPPELVAAATSGIVIVEFVVDSTGGVEETTFGVLSSTHPLFARAVEDALASAHFSPARSHGRPVRQILQMQFRFDAPGRGGRR
jgi:TonB family protein